jgi:hypothetical protein
MAIDKQLPGLHRLDFVLPHFLRISWTSPEARQVWAARLWRILDVWPTLECLSISHRLRDCALIKTSPGSRANAMQYWSSLGLSAIPVDQDGNEPNQAGDGGSMRNIALGFGARAGQLRDACVAEDHRAVGLLLGYPECCTNVFVEQFIASGALDSTWVIPFASCRRPLPTEGLELASNPVVNVLWRCVAVHAIPHVPCSSVCARSIALGREFLNVGIRVGFPEEMAWLEEILSWPAEWSALHGIAELKTPVFKLCTRTDATGEKLVIRWAGSTYPKEGALGITFPYRLPERKALTESPAFQRGLSNTSQLIGIQPNRP